MEMKALEYFVAIVEKGGLSKAAQHLYVTQPSLSQFLVQLERAENAKLLTKKKNNTLHLTEAGELYYESAKQILRIRDEYQKRLEDISSSMLSCISFGVIGQKGLNLATQILQSLSSRYPKKNVTIVHDNRADHLQDMVADGDIDMAYSAYFKKNSKLCYIDFPSSEVALILPKDHPLAAQAVSSGDLSLPRIRLSHAKLESPIMLSPQSVLQTITADYLKANNVTTSGSIVVHDISFAYSLVEKGLGISLLPLNMLPETLPASLCALALDPPLPYTVAMYYSRSHYQTAFMRDFIKTAQSIASSGKPL